MLSQIRSSSRAARAERRAVKYAANDGYILAAGQPDITAPQPELRPLEIAVLAALMIGTAGFLVFAIVFLLTTPGPQ